MLFGDIVGHQSWTVKLPLTTWKLLILIIHSASSFSTNHQNTWIYYKWPFLKNYWNNKISHRWPELILAIGYWFKVDHCFLITSFDKCNNKITEHRAIFQRHRQNSKVNTQIQSVNNRKTGKTAIALTWYRHF